MDFLAAYAAKHPDKPAAIDDRAGEPVRTVTYQRFNAEVNRIADALARTGLAAGERLAWHSRNAIEILEVQHAVRKLGAQAVALNPRLQRNEIESILSASKAAVVWVEADSASLFDGIGATTEVRDVIVFGGPPRPGQRAASDLLASASDAEPSTPPIPDAFQATISFTSGTTGKPKGVLRTRPMPVEGSEMRLQKEVWGDGPHIYLISGSMSHGGPGGFAHIAISRGDTIVVQRRFDPEDWLRLVERYRVTFSYCAPTIIRQVCNLPAEVKDRYDRTSIQVIFAGAAKWSYALKLAYRRDFPPGTLWEIYGSTETVSNTVMRPDEHWGRPESCGRPVPGVEIVLLDEEGSVITEPNQRGLLYAKSDSLFDAYDGDPEAQAASTWGDGYFTVGDVAYFDDDGYYYICDRQKDMVVTGGVNVYPQEIEAVLDSCEDVYEVAVIGIPDEEWGEKLHALVVLKDGATMTPEELSTYCSEHLASYKVPRSIEFVDELPRTPSGKVLKRELRDRYWAGSGRLI